MRPETLWITNPVVCVIFQQFDRIVVRELGSHHYFESPFVVFSLLFECVVYTTEYSWSLLSKIYEILQYGLQDLGILAPVRCDQS